MPAKLLIIIDQAPKPDETLANLKFKETIDAALGVAAFGIEVSLWFSGDGVHCLQKSKQFKIIEALNYYDIENIYVIHKDWGDFKDLATTITQVDDRELSTIVKQQQTILRMN